MIIEKVSSIRNFQQAEYIGALKTKAITKISAFKYVPEIRLSKSIFQYPKPPEVLNCNPNIIIGNLYTDIKDDKIKSFWTEYRAYNFEGYDNVFPNNYICIDSRGDRRMKPHIHIDLVEVKSEYGRQGAYKNAIKKLIEISKREGCEGRITLDSLKINHEGSAKIPSPSLAHWKCGFRFANEENNKIMQKVLRGELPPEAAPEGSMYYKGIDILS